MRGSRSGLVFAMAVAWVALHPAPVHAQVCTRTISAGTSVSAAVASASAGSTLCLNTGSYGDVTLSGVVKSPRVVVRSVTGRGASLLLTLQSGTRGITFDSVTVTGSRIVGSTTRDITVQNSTFTGHAVFDELVNSNVLFDHNSHNDIEGGGQYSSPARLHIAYSSQTHSGITIQNSVMDGGSADGVQSGTGVDILDNVFLNIREGACADCHTDAIQLLTATGSVVRGNYIYDCASGIVAYDGITRATIENNVIDLGANGRPWGIELYSDDSSVVRHNTLPYRSNCAWNQACGTISLDRKSADPAGVGTIIVDNIATSISAGNGSTYAERHHNLVRSDADSGDLVGAPTYVGGALPAAYADFRLAAGSLGKGAASVPLGADIGINVGAPTAPAAPGNLRVVQ